MSKPPTVVEVTWERDLVFTGASDGVQITLDSASKAGPSPMQAVAFGLAGCMAIDLVHILRKGRFDLRGVRAMLTGERAQEDPRRFTRIALHYTITGDIPDEKVRRAIDLSRDKYCSVWHSLRRDLPLEVTFDVRRGR